MIVLQEDAEEQQGSSLLIKKEQHYEPNAAHPFELNFGSLVSDCVVGFPVSDPSARDKRARR